MIILEGPDGAGKTTLREQLVGGTNLLPAPRAASSEGGPVDNLAEWVLADWTRWSWPQPCMVYDRHPLISEYVYGPLTRGKVQSGMDHPSMMGQRRRVAMRALVVLCLPPLEVVRANVEGEGVQMAGVVGNIEALWSAYQALEAGWPGWIIRYDYTSDKYDFDSVLRAVRLHTHEWSKR